MKKTLLFLALALSSGIVSAQKGSAWQKVGTDKVSGRQAIRTSDIADNQRLYQVNQVQLQQTLAAAPAKLSGQRGVEVLMPNTKGEMERFLVWENSNFEPELQAQFPEIRAYSGKGISDPNAVINFSVSPLGVKTMVLRAGNSSEFIEPFTTDRSVYVLYDSASRTRGNLPWVCGTHDVALSQELNSQAARSNNQSYKTMRLALSCTGEYAAYFGGTVAGALAGMNATMARVNGVMEKDLAIHLNIIAGTTSVIYTNASTDPYSAATAGSGGAWNTELQNTLTSVLGNAAYDIGHLFGASGGGGNAGCIGCVCVDDTASLTDKNKGSGFTSPADAIPEGDNFDIDYVIHEMGHQLGGNHTFSIGSGGVENNSVNVEPGSGSTIMAYAGITEADVQSHSDPYFAYRSILQIQTNMATKTCPVSVATANHPPTVDAGADFTIPKGTAFKLVGTGSDQDGDALVYNWEENDDANVPLGYAAALAASYPSPTKTNGPNFRSLTPVPTPVRYMPAFSSVLNGNLTTIWETVSTVARTLNFTLTARDNQAQGQTNTDAMVVTVNGTAGPFAITYPNTVNETWIQNTSKTITWDVAGTTGNGVNTANVNILFSPNGGESWTTLVANTPNDGSESITVPNVAAPFCRIMVEAVGNIFYAVSKSFAVGYNVVTTTTCNTYTSSPATAIVGQAQPAWSIVGQITVPAGEGVTISDVNVSLNITHPKINDLYIGVIPPLPGAPTVGDIRILYQQGCPTTSTAGMNTTFDDSAPVLNCSQIAAGSSFRPANSLDIFNGTNSAGTWRIAIADLTVADSGTLNSFGINICQTTTTTTLATESFELSDFSLFPNPNNGSFNVKFTPNGINDINIEVHDVQGRRIFGKTYPASGAFEENLQLQSVQSGVYLVTVQNGASKVVKRIVVE